MAVPGVVSVRVPATSANLGPGFDALGVALALHDEVTAEVVDGPTRVTVTGEGAGELPTDQRHLVVRAMRTGFAAAGVPEPPAVALTCRNRIPQERGLGSSAAAIVAGVLLARELLDPAGPDRPLDDDAVLRVAAAVEGHPDNVAACLAGGLTIAWSGPDGACAVRLAPHPEVRPTVFVPVQRGVTAAARAALPPEVPHRDAAHAAGRAALLVHALTAAPELLGEATEDRLHQPYRAPDTPATADLVARLRTAGLPAVVSGAGPAVLSLTRVPSDFSAGGGWLRHDPAVDLGGAASAAGTMMTDAGEDVSSDR